MKIALIGYGKMGHAIEQIALSRGHEIAITIDAGQQERFSAPDFLHADVAIEFTTPATAVDNFRRVIDAGIPLVAGTTGWLDHLEEVKAMLDTAPQGMFWTSNFSIGVALFRAIAAKAEALIAPYSQYHPEITEVHHIHKLDSPSGTAKSLASIVEEGMGVEPEISAERIGEVPGTHSVSFLSSCDRLTFTH